ncbi:flagellin [Alkalihalobacillus sp. MEB130]|uniref:flagellin n=1 Tax=Alkalihalobacillus sp. MEB130 TaxID=2976704 RepID=UPI0028DE6D93|nr:flagellin [Alkalihalobacillus sp. MEB130]MDT8858770.1 flagellin [Alkalihalobacillus sp. MEB130]
MKAPLTGNDTYDFRLSSSTLDYGVGTDNEPRAIRVYQEGQEVPYSAEHGFTYNPETNILSLHGDFRPDKDSDAGDFRVYSIEANSLRHTLPPYSYVYKVELNGQEVERADSIDGNGYYFDGQTVELVGDARPNVTNATGAVQLNVFYYDSLDILLNTSPVGDDYLTSCGCSDDAQLLFSEIDPEELVVSFNGQALNEDQYSLQGNRIVLDREKVDAHVGANTIEVNYRMRHIIGYESNEFTFQVGANAGQSYQVEIQSFNNMLKDTNRICVLTHEEANRSITLADRALSFVSIERSKIGAVQNRLSSMSSNLGVFTENMTASMSRIEDADLAKEIMNVTRENILSRVQVAMQTQMQQSSQKVLELLR